MCIALGTIVRRTAGGSHSSSASSSCFRASSRSPRRRGGAIPSVPPPRRQQRSGSGIERIGICSPFRGFLQPRSTRVTPSRRSHSRPLLLVHATPDGLYSSRSPAGRHLAPPDPERLVHPRDCGPQRPQVWCGGHWPPRSNAASAIPPRARPPSIRRERISAVLRSVRRAASRRRVQPFSADSQGPAPAGPGPDRPADVPAKRPSQCSSASDPASRRMLTPPAPRWCAGSSATRTRPGLRGMPLAMDERRRDLRGS